MSELDFRRDKIKAAEDWLRDERDVMTDLLKRQERAREEQRDNIERARRRLMLNQKAYNALTDDPWCNHDAVAMSRGVCECGVRVSELDRTQRASEGPEDQYRAQPAVTDTVSASAAAIARMERALQ